MCSNFCHSGVTFLRPDTIHFAGRDIGCLQLQEEDALHAAARSDIMCMCQILNYLNCSLFDCAVIQSDNANA